MTDKLRTPLYTVSEASRLVEVAPETLRGWAAAGSGRSLVTRLDRAPGAAESIPFVGLAEAYILASMRRAGVPVRRIRPALEVLDKDVGIDHALASKRLFTDGVEVLYDFGQRSGLDDVQELVVVRSGQRVFTEVVVEYLSLVTFGDDGYPDKIRLPQYRSAAVIVDPQRSFGQPILASGGARVSDVLSLFGAGESLSTVCLEFGVSEMEMEDVLRVASAGTTRTLP